MSVAGTRVLVIVINISIHLMAAGFHYESWFTRQLGFSGAENGSEYDFGKSTLTGHLLISPDCV